MNPLKPAGAVTLAVALGRTRDDELKSGVGSGEQRFGTGEAHASRRQPSRRPDGQGRVRHHPQERQERPQLHVRGHDHRGHARDLAVTESGKGLASRTLSFKAPKKKKR
jgi:hypothetical protein